MKSPQMIDPLIIQKTKFRETIRTKDKGVRQRHQNRCPSKWKFIENFISAGSVRVPEEAPPAQNRTLLFRKINHQS